MFWLCEACIKTALLSMPKSNLLLETGGGGGGGGVARSVERATLGEEVLGWIPAVAARSLLFGSVSV